MLEKKLISYIDLVSEKIGGKVLYATDDFFAEKENLIKEGRGVFIPDKYTDKGKWMDGWESRRKRTPGHDWCIIKLGTAGIIKGFDIDTNHFLGNHPSFASIEAINLNNKIEDWSKSDELEWNSVLEKKPLNPGKQHFFKSKSQNIFTHIRLHIYPDGGVARLRVYGEVFKNWDSVDSEQLIDLALITNGGKTLACNDMYFSNMANLILPFKGKNMGDGWETKRSRTPNNIDWVIIKLGHKGFIHKTIIDTSYFKGNYPDTFEIDACNSVNDKDVLENKVNWFKLLNKQKLCPNQEVNFLIDSLKCKKEITHVKLKIYPDGGISRLRLIGTIT